MPNYTAKWAQAGHPTVASVSFEASSDYHAKIQANRIANELGVTNTPRTIQKGAELVECIQTGVNKLVV
jgi:hypothetical protein